DRAGVAGLALGCRGGARRLGSPTGATTARWRRLTACSGWLSATRPRIRQTGPRARTPIAHVAPSTPTGGSKMRRPSIVALAAAAFLAAALAGCSTPAPGPQPTGQTPAQSATTGAPIGPGRVEPTSAVQSYRVSY